MDSHIGSDGISPSASTSPEVFLQYCYDEAKKLLSGIEDELVFQKTECDDCPGWTIYAKDQTCPLGYKPPSITLWVDKKSKLHWHSTGGPTSLWAVLTFLFFWKNR